MELDISSKICYPNSKLERKAKDAKKADTEEQYYEYIYYAYFHFQFLLPFSGSGKRDLLAYFTFCARHG